MQEVRDIAVPGTHGRPIYTDVFIPDGKGPFPLLVFAHGFKGFKDWGHFNQMAGWWVSRGFAFCKFNFSHNGIDAPGSAELTDLEAFGNNNFSIELDDLGNLFDWLEQQREVYAFDLDRLFLAGHSRGGGLAMLKATEDTRIKKVISWAGVPDLAKYWYGDLLDNWKKEGVQYVVNSRTGQKLPMYIQFYEDYEAHKARLDLVGRMHLLQQPLLHIHGDADEAVPVSWAHDLKERHPDTALHILSGMNHVFGSKHPWEKDEMAEGVLQVLTITEAFLKKE